MSVKRVDRVGQMRGNTFLFFFLFFSFFLILFFTLFVPFFFFFFFSNLIYFLSLSLPLFLNLRKNSQERGLDTEISCEFNVGEATGRYSTCFVGQLPLLFTQSSRECDIASVLAS